MRAKVTKTSIRNLKNPGSLSFPHKYWKCTNTPPTHKPTPALLLLSPAALASHWAGGRDKPLKTMRMIMADATAPQNSISAQTSMRMSVKVKYARRRVLKDATQGSQKQQQEMKRTMRGGKQEEGREIVREKRKRRRGERKIKIMCLYCSASEHYSTGILSSPTLTTDCE